MCKLSQEDEDITEYILKWMLVDSGASVNACPKSLAEGHSKSVAMAVGVADDQMPAVRCLNITAPWVQSIDMMGVDLEASLSGEHAWAATVARSVSRSNEMRFLRDVVGAPIAILLQFISHSVAPHCMSGLEFSLHHAGLKRKLDAMQAG